MPRRGLVAGPDFEFFQRRYFTPAEVAQHNRPEDLWVSYLGYVYDLTPLAQEYKGDLLLKPIVEVAGQDISHWFDPKTRDIRKHIDPMTGCLWYRTPRGRFVHIPPQQPRSDWANDFGKPWWQGSRYEVGRLSTKTRNIRIINTLTSQEHTLENSWGEVFPYSSGGGPGVNVGNPTPLSPYNSHAASYTWKYEGKNLNMDYTLEENGIRDEEEEFDLLNMDSTFHIPALLLYFNDDLTEL